MNAKFCSFKYPRCWKNNPTDPNIDHSNEALNIDFGQGGAKISEVKVEGRKYICLLARFKTDARSADRVD